jgi:hypothetical protein
MKRMKGTDSNITEDSQKGPKREGKNMGLASEVIEKSREDSMSHSKRYCREEPEACRIETA